MGSCKDRKDTFNTVCSILVAQQSFLLNTQSFALDFGTLKMSPKNSRTRSILLLNEASLRQKNLKVGRFHKHVTIGCETVNHYHNIVTTGTCDMKIYSLTYHIFNVFYTSHSGQMSTFSHKYHHTTHRTY